MIRDVTVTVDFQNLDGTPGQINMTITGDQLEQTVKRRMQTLMPKTTNYRFSEVVQETLAIAEAPRGKK